MDLLRYFEKQQIKNIDRPKLQAGDLVRVETKIQEGEKTRTQIFEGVVLSIRGSGPSATFTVRRETGRFAVERIFPLYNPLITNIEIVKRQKVRRAKLSFLRQAGRRRVKEDERAMQRHIETENERKRVEEAAKKKLEEEKIKAEKEKIKEEKAKTKTEEDKNQEDKKTEDKK